MLIFSEREGEKSSVCLVCVDNSLCVMILQKQDFCVYRLLCAGLVGNAITV